MYLFFISTTISLKMTLASLESVKPSVKIEAREAVLLYEMIPNIETTTNIK